MEDVSAILPGLRALAQRDDMHSLLFSFPFNGLRVRGVYFDGPVTLTIAITDANVGWQVDVSSGKLSTWIPSESYKVIGQALKDETGDYANKPFFMSLKAALEGLVATAEANQPSDDELRQLLASCKTKDKKYDKEGDLPFFHHWRRVAPTKEALAKIQRTFGREIREHCYKHRVTGVWSGTPKPDSLIFLAPQAALHKMEV